MVKYSLIPIACCQLDLHTLQFSKEALNDLVRIDKAISKSMSSSKRRNKEAIDDEVIVLI